MKKLYTKLAAAFAAAAMFMGAVACPVTPASVYGQEEEISAYESTTLYPSDLTAKTYTSSKKVNIYFTVQGSSDRPITVDSDGFHFVGVGRTNGGSIKIRALKGETITFTGSSSSGFYIQDNSNANVYSTTDSSGGSFTANDLGYYYLSPLGAGTITMVSVGSSGGGDTDTTSATVTTTESTTESTTVTTTESTTVTTTESTTVTTTESTTESTTVTTTESTTESTTASTSESSTESTTEDAYMWGDADSSGTLTANDAAYILHHMLFPTTLNLSDEVVKHCDVTNDGRVLSEDAAWVLQKVLDSGFQFKLPPGAKQ